jgi:hypothetical protein
LVLLVIAGTPACALPGSRIGYFRINGEIADAPVGGEAFRVRIVLPKEYGLGGLDGYFGEPEDYGHEDMIVYAEPDAEGRFSVTHESLSHMSVLLIPPLGIIPRKPPLPTYLLGFSNVRDEIYVVQFEDQKPVCRVFSASTKEQIPVGESFWSIGGGQAAYRKIADREGWDIFLEMEKTSPPEKQGSKL